MHPELSSPARSGFALFALGFRPFFLAAGVFAIVLIGLWLAVLHGRVVVAPLAAPLWHGHEMLFGFAVAVIAGFLLTAAQNWTGIPTLAGTRLAALFLLWLAARVAFLVPALPAGLVAAIDLAFLPLLAVALALPISKAKQAHNVPFPAMLLALTAANALVHAEALGASDTASLGLRFAAFIVVAMMVLMGGRVIPSFTDNRLRTRARRWPALEKAVPFVTVAALVAALIAPASWLTALLAAGAAVVHAVRLGGWYTAKYWSVPLLWILHLGYAWIVVGFALLAAAAAGVPGAQDGALHAFTAGGIGVLTLGMMARVSLGHTGRLLEAPSVMRVAFWAINLAALVRVGQPLVLASHYTSAMALAGTLWLAAFGVFVAVYAPMLLQPRVDGKPG
jgi:uncharacterized protein involved in response to NO